MVFSSDRHGRKISQIYYCRFSRAAGENDAAAKQARYNVSQKVLLGIIGVLVAGLAWATITERRNAADIQTCLVLSKIWSSLRLLPRVRARTRLYGSNTARLRVNQS